MKPKALKVLIVDDDAFIAIMLKDFFKGSGYELITAEDGEEALKMCLEKKPDFIITDIMLPKKTGIELIKELRMTSEFAVIPIIAFTAGTKQMREDALSAGAHLVLEKPVRRMELLQKVDELLSASPFVPR